MSTEEPRKGLLERLGGRADEPKAIDPQIRAEYDATRPAHANQNLCNAPFSNMYFAIDGRVGACWLSFAGAPTWPDQSIHEIWFGSFFERLRRNIRADDLGEYTGCTVCKKNIETRNFHGTLARAYDLEVPVQEYPTIMELELSNVCNLECIMCRGELSSSIRKNRDNKPPLPIPYDHRFVEQLEEFIPHLAEMRFNGGEPFLHGIFYEIFEKVAAIKPGIEITMATNGTVFNKRVKETLERGRFRINVSVDGFTPETFEAIRKNARHEIVFRNARYFADYCRDRGTIFSIMANPMRQNWQEMPDLLEWCNESGYHLSFNTIITPDECSLVSWDATNLERVYETLSQRGFDQDPDEAHPVRHGNTERYRNLVEHQIREWWMSKRAKRKFFTTYYES